MSRNVNRLSASALRVSAFPIVLGQRDEHAFRRYVDFFTVEIRNPNTRKAYRHAVDEFLSWVEGLGIDLCDIAPIHVAGWVEIVMRQHSTATVKQRLAALRMFFDWMVVGQILAANPASPVRSPRQSIRKGKTPVLAPDEARHLLQAIDSQSIIGLRDRALIGLMIFTFARIGAALAMKVEDVYVQNRRLWVRLHEKGGKLHEMPCQHELECWLHDYIEAAGIGADRSGYLFRTIDRTTKTLSSRPLPQANAYGMVKRRARQVGIETEITNHSFRAIGITAYLSNGGTLEQAARMANHSSTRTTQLYDRRDDRITIGEVEKVRI